MAVVAFPVAEFFKAAECFKAKFGPDRRNGSEQERSRGQSEWQRISNSVAGQIQPKGLSLDLAVHGGGGTAHRRHGQK